MSVSRDEAAASLRAIDHARGRSLTALRYARSGPCFILWGVIWILGYAGSDLLPRLGYSPRGRNWLWLALMTVGFVCTVLIIKRQERTNTADAGIAGPAWRLWIGGVVVFSLFIAALYVVIGPRFEQLAAAFFPLLAALFYGLAGLKWGVRYIITSVAVTALTLTGYLYVPEHFLLWMAAVGGGSLLLVGLWMSKV